MELSKSETVWETTNVTNLLRNRQNGTYSARVKVNGKQKWRGLETTDHETKGVGLQQRGAPCI